MQVGNKFQTDFSVLKIWRNGFKLCKVELNLDLKGTPCDTLASYLALVC